MSCRGLRSPLWWASLAILALNDHVLKGSGVLPASITGKLSDFAGLVVAPVLLCALAGARGLVSRLACFALVVAPFVAIKVSEAAASSVEAAFGALGPSWRLWVDWTDLCALAILPFAWKLVAPPPEGRKAPHHRRGTLERAGVLLGALACLATSDSGGIVEASLFLVNASSEDTRIALRRPSAELDCEALRQAPEAGLSPEQFDTFSCKDLRSMFPLPLDRDVTDPPQMSPAPAPRVCDAVLLSSPALGGVLVFWNQVERVGREDVGLDRLDESDPHTLYLEPFGDRLVVAETPLARVWLVDGWTAGENCW